MDKFIIRKDIYNQLAKSFLNAESIEKARGLPDGSVRTWGGVDYKKLNGKWKPIGKNKKGALQEETKKKGKVDTETTEKKDSGELSNDIKTALESYANAGMKQDQVITSLENMIENDSFSGPDAKKNKESVYKIIDMLKKDSSLLEKMGGNSKNKISSGSTHAEGDIVQFKDASGKKHNGKVLMVNKDSVSVIDNVTKNKFDVKHDDIKVLAKVNDKDAIRNFYDASGMKPNWRDGSDGKQPESCDSLEGLLKAAGEVQKEFGALSDKRQEYFKSVLGIDTLLLKRKALKNADRIKEKLRTDQAEATSPEMKGKIYDEETDTYHCRTIRDTDGHTFTCKSIDDLQQVFNYFKDQPDIIRMKNNFANPTDVGYSDINMNIRLSNGTIAEIQLNTTANIVAKERYGHALYEVYRSIENEPEYKELANIMAEAQKKLYGLSNKYSKDGTFPDISQDEVFSKDYKYEPYAAVIRDYISDAFPLFLKAKSAGIINEKTANHFHELIKYIK